MQRRAQELEVFAKRSLGQNFLISDHVVEKITAKVMSHAVAVWLEIGPGLGALTDALLERGVRPELIELDSKLAAYWRARGLTVHEMDALHLNWRQFLAPQNLGLVSNLPYQIAASLVVECSASAPRLLRMVLMFQKEVAQRITASPRTKSYGLLSVMAQAHWRVEPVVDAGPRDFWPAPKVASRVLGFERLPDPLAGRSQEFLKFLKAAFARRRKLMAKNLSEAGYPAPTIQAGLVEMGFSPERARAEELSVAEFLRLFGLVVASGKAAEKA